MLGRAVKQDVHVRADMQMTELQRARQREDQRDVLHLVRRLADCLNHLWGSLREATRKGCVAVDVKLEKVEEGVADHGDGAVLLSLDSVVELKRRARLVADGEGDPFDLVRGIFNMFARFAKQKSIR